MNKEIADPTDPTELQDHIREKYLDMQFRLVGRPRPLPVGDSDVTPPPTEETMQLFYDVVDVISHPKFPRLIELLKREAANRTEKTKAAKSTEAELRQAKFLLELAEWPVIVATSFLAEVENGIAANKAALARAEEIRARENSPT